MKEYYLIWDNENVDNTFRSNGLTTKYINAIFEATENQKLYAPLFTG